MKEKLTFLGIETSCDETAASIVREKSDGTGEILSNIVSSQIEEHKEFGGVVPEIAARAHVEKIELIIKKALKESNINLDDINGISATAGPGLIVCLTVGSNVGKAIAGSLNKPFVAVNHLEGHALSPKINNKIKFPYLLLLISGGHTQFLEVNGVNSYKRLGTTIDDALGEAFDKTAKFLGIEFPGGPKIEEWAKKGDENYFKLPKPILKKGGCNLSFAGLKTAVLRISKDLKNEKEKYHLAASFQKTINEILYEKTKIAMKEFLKVKQNKKNTFVIAGGVAANLTIRKNLTKLATENQFTSIFPPINLCSDNAAMIAWAGIERYIGGKIEENPFSFDNLVKFSLIVKFAASPPAIT
jgi:N6-L-threonylcarbamoyladenine synthase